MALPVDLPTSVALTLVVVLFVVLFRAASLRASRSMAGKGAILALPILGGLFLWFGAPVCGSSFLLLFVLAVAFVVLRRRKGRESEDHVPEAET